MNLSGFFFVSGLGCLVLVFKHGAGDGGPEHFFARAPLGKIIMTQQLVRSALYLFLPAAAVFWSMG